MDEGNDDRGGYRQGEGASQAQAGVGTEGHSRGGTGGLDQGNTAGTERTESGINDAGGDDPARGGTGQDGSRDDPKPEATEEEQGAAQRRQEAEEDDAA